MRIPKAGIIAGTQPGVKSRYFASLFLTDGRTSVLVVFGCKKLQEKRFRYFGNGQGRNLDLVGKDLTMRTVRLSALFLVFVSTLVVSGCNSKLKDLRIQNETQRKRISQLEAELQAGALQLDQLKRQLGDAEAKGGVEVDTLKQQITALEQDLAKKNELLASMQQKLLYGTALPVELSTMLEDFAKTHSDIVEFDANTGIVKFKSDLLFDKGSANVAATAVDAVKSLCGIINSEEGKKFDIIIAGHTDDIPIRKADTKAEHPTNWHLSAHRGISVLNVMTANQVDSKRVSVRAFGEYRPIEPNAANNGGNAKNRRVEIYIVPEGA